MIPRDGRFAVSRDILLSNPNIVEAGGRLRLEVRGAAPNGEKSDHVCLNSAGFQLNRFLLDDETHADFGG